MSSTKSEVAQRAERAEEIAKNPQNYKICEGCESIVAQRVPTCPNCHGYRFNENLEEISLHARILGAREKTTVTSEDLT